MDKSKWPPGPWHDEEDEIEFETQAGYAALIKRGPVGNLNGYVVIPESHPMFGKSYDDIPVDVHGGVTYSREHDDGWMVGFDTAHAGDTNPATLMYMGGSYPSKYRDMAYVRNEVESLATQLLKIQKGAK